MDNPLEDRQNMWVLQQKLEAWRQGCFGNDGDVANNQLLGVVEEVGELTHHFLKKRQGIRLDEDHDGEIEDAIGDITIYLMNFCSQLGIDYGETVQRIADEVMLRTKKDQVSRTEGK